MKLIVLVLFFLFIASMFLSGMFGKNASDVADSLIYGSKKIIEKFIFLSTLTLHFLGQIGILIILGSALLILFNEMTIALKLPPLIEGEAFELLLSIFSKPHAWAAATAVIAATTAITASKKFEMDRQENLNRMRLRSRENIQVRQKEGLYRPKSKE